MTVRVKDGSVYDTMKEACNRLGISRPTMLRYLKEGFFDPPNIHPQGRGKDVRYFDEEWYVEAERRLSEARKKNTKEPGSEPPTEDTPPS